MLLPGLLGSLFVFAGILGYQKLGAAATISILVASQLCMGLLADVYRAARRRCARICRRWSAPYCWWRAPIWWRNAAFDGG